jgi:hypothetical protein
MSFRSGPRCFTSGGAETLSGIAVSSEVARGGAGEGFVSIFLQPVPLTLMER